MWKAWRHFVWPAPVDPVDVYKAYLPGLYNTVPRLRVTIQTPVPTLDPSLYAGLRLEFVE
jgi:hypothetical protein